MRPFFIFLALQASFSVMAQDGGENCEILNPPVAEIGAVVDHLQKSCQAIACGDSGSIADRIKNCAQMDGKAKRKAGYHLVARTTACREIYQDAVTKTVWSDVTSFDIPYEVVQNKGKENEKVIQFAERACERLASYEVADLGGEWRLPTKDEFGKTPAKRAQLAKLPRMNDLYWTSSPDEKNKERQNYYFDGLTEDMNTGEKKAVVGEIKKANKKESKIRVRCVLK